MTTVKNLSTSPKVIKEQAFHEPRRQEDIETSSSHLFQPIEEIVEPWITYDGEQPLEPEIEELLTCLSPDLLYIQNTNHPKEGNLHGMAVEDIPNEKEDQGYHDYIEQWFQTMITSKKHYLL